jgi:hypothetical protein
MLGDYATGGLMQIAAKAFPYGLGEVMCRIPPGFVMSLCIHHVKNSVFDNKKPEIGSKTGFNFGLFHMILTS